MTVSATPPSSKEEAFAGKTAQIRIPTSVACEVCSGTGAKAGTKPKACATCGGAGKIRHAQGFFTLERTCPACQGRGQVIDDPCPSCAGAGEPAAGAILDPGRDIDRQHALARDTAGAGAGRTGIVDYLAAALAGRTGALEREEALGMPDLAGAATGRARLRLGAGLGAGARADFAGDRGRNADLGGLALERLFEGDLHVVAQVGAALAALAAAAAAPAAAHAA